MNDFVKMSKNIIIPLKLLFIINLHLVIHRNSNMLAKIACNATNSAAIDNKGNLYVWGFANYGLCGSIEI